jgi:hypothetical protein
MLRKIAACLTGLQVGAAFIRFTARQNLLGDKHEG